MDEELRRTRLAAAFLYRFVARFPCVTHSQVGLASSALATVRACYPDIAILAAHLEETHEAVAAEMDAEEAAAEEAEE